MLRKLITPTTKRVVGRAPVAYAQQRFRRVDIFADKPKLTTETALKGLDLYLGAKEDYVSKYPDTTLEKYGAQLKEQLNKSVYIDPAAQEYVNSLLGFNEDEVNWIMTGKYPELYEWKGQELYVHWDAVGKMFSRTDTEKGLVADIESAFKRLKSAEEDLEKVENVKIDWAHWESRLGDSAKQLKADLDYTIEQMNPDLDINKFEEGLNNHMQPIVDQVKDLLIEELEHVKVISDDLVRESQFLRSNEQGEPIYQFDSPYFLDKFAPEERDEIILEIENDDWDTEYQKEIKAARVSPDELIEYNKQWWSDASAEIEEEQMKSLLGEGAMTERQQKEQVLFTEVNSAAKKTKALETEVNSLKAKLESEAEGASGEVKKEKKSLMGLKLSEEEWNAYLQKKGVKEGSGINRDFKHMTPEQVKEWETRSLAAREAAEKNLATISK